MKRQYVSQFSYWICNVPSFLLCLLFVHSLQGGQSSHSQKFLSSIWWIIFRSNLPNKVPATRSVSICSGFKILRISSVLLRPSLICRWCPSKSPLTRWRSLSRSMLSSYNSWVTSVSAVFCIIILVDYDGLNKISNGNNNNSFRRSLLSGVNTPDHSDWVVMERRWARNRGGSSHIRNREASVMADRFLSHFESEVEVANGRDLSGESSERA